MNWSTSGYYLIQNFEVCACGLQQQQQQQRTTNDTICHKINNVIECNFRFFGIMAVLCSIKFSLSKKKLST